MSSTTQVILNAGEQEIIESKKNNKFLIAYFFEKAAMLVTKATGSNLGITLAFLSVIAWLFTGPYFNFSEQWEVTMSTATTIITFLMVFLIQKSQNKDAMAIHLKLNELVAAHERASNRLIDIENMTEEELKVIKKYYAKLSDFTKQDPNLQKSHSIDETEVEHNIKQEMEDELVKQMLARLKVSKEEGNKM